MPVGYVVNVCVLQLVFLLSVEHEAVLVQKAHDWRLPARASQEIDDDVEEPVLWEGSARGDDLRFPTRSAR